jgi:hypothetical protein
MTYPACEKLEIIQLIELSCLPVRRTLEKLGIPSATFYHQVQSIPHRPSRYLHFLGRRNARR